MKIVKDIWHFFSFRVFSVMLLGNFFPTHAQSDVTPFYLSWENDKWSQIRSQILMPQNNHPTFRSKACESLKSDEYVADLFAKYANHPDFKNRALKWFAKANWACSEDALDSALQMHHKLYLTFEKIWQKQNTPKPEISTFTQLPSVVKSLQLHPSFSDLPHHGQKKIPYVTWLQKSFQVSAFWEGMHHTQCHESSFDVASIPQNQECFVLWFSWGLWQNGHFDFQSASHSKKELENAFLNRYSNTSPLPTHLPSWLLMGFYHPNGLKEQERFNGSLELTSWLFQKNPPARYAMLLSHSPESVSLWTRGMLGPENHKQFFKDLSKRCDFAVRTLQELNQIWKSPENHLRLLSPGEIRARKGRSYGVLGGLLFSVCSTSELVKHQELWAPGKEDSPEWEPSMEDLATIQADATLDQDLKLDLGLWHHYNAPSDVQDLECFQKSLSPSSHRLREEALAPLYDTLLYQWIQNLVPAIPVAYQTTQLVDTTSWDRRIQSVMNLLPSNGSWEHEDLVMVATYLEQFKPFVSTHYSRESLTQGEKKFAQELHQILLILAGKEATFAPWALQMQYQMHPGLVKHWPHLKSSVKGKSTKELDLLSQRISQDLQKWNTPESDEFHSTIKRYLDFYFPSKTWDKSLLHKTPISNLEFLQQISLKKMLKYHYFLAVQEKRGAPTASLQRNLKFRAKKLNEIITKKLQNQTKNSRTGDSV